MDKLNLMKAVLTLYVCAVSATFLFHPTVKEYLPAKIEGNTVCILSSPVRHEKLMAQFLLIGNNRYGLQLINDKCFELSSGPLASNIVEGKVLLVKEGRSLWTTLTKKNDAL
jgi:hypothetical protein